MFTKNIREFRNRFYTLYYSLVKIMLSLFSKMFVNCEFEFYLNVFKTDFMRTRPNKNN